MRPFADVRRDAHSESECSFTRREFLAFAGAGLLASALPSCAVRSPRSDYPGSLQNPIYYSSTRALATAIRRRELSSEEVVRASLDRVAAVNGELNAVVQIGADQAIARSREADAASARGETWGPLHGVPMTIKDSFDTAGMITAGGTRGRAAFVPERDATVVSRLRRAGAILLGKTNTPELTLGFETDNLVYGRANNPYDLSRTPGGSSGGAAAIVAAGGTPFDIGSDYGGSIRLPSHFCGISGIKPSAGRVPRTGHIYPFGGLQDSFQQVGPLARYVDDLILLLPLIAGPDGIDPGIVPQPWQDPAEIDLRSLRISYHTDNGVVTASEETRRTVEAVAEGLSSSVQAMDESRPTGVDAVLEFLGLYSWDGGARVERLLRTAGTTEHTLGRSIGREPMSAVQLTELITRWYEWRSRMHSFMERYDVILCPVSATPAVPHGATATPGAVAAFSYTLTYNLTGWPCAVVRAGTSPEGLPIGIQIVTRPGREDLALAVAKQVEAAHGGYQRPALLALAG
jgi:amidase